MVFRVLVSDPVDKEGIKLLSQVAKVDVLTKLPEDEICKIIGDYDALMVRSGTKVTSRIISNSKNLRIIGRAGVGVDNVDVKTATDKGIYVVNSPLGNVVAAAELTLGLMLSLVRHIPKGDASIRNGKWDRASCMGSELYGKRLGIVGLGQVGGHVARVAGAAGMKLCAYDPYVNDTRAMKFECEMMTLEDVLRQSDFVTLHIPLVAETKHLINSETLSLMQPTARLINASRGGVVDENALAEALRQNTLAGAALDVFESETAFPPDHPLLNCPNILLTPHLGASTEEAQKSVAIDVASQICAALAGGIPRSAVNAPMTLSPGNEELALMKCSESIGRIAAQMLNGPLVKIEVTMEGAFADQKSEPVLLAVANGALGVHTTVRVNYVNVRNIADNYQIRLIISKDGQKIKAGVRVELTTDCGNTVSVVGSITADGAPLLKSIQNTPVFLIIPSGSPMLYCDIVDRPSTMSNITSTLGAADVNIANCHLGRVNTKKPFSTTPATNTPPSSMPTSPRQPSATHSPQMTPSDGTPSAVLLFHLDEEIQPEVLNDLRKLEVIKKCVFFTC